jgi:hypothetical protein
LPDKNRSLGQAVCRNSCNILRFLTKMLWWLLKENAGILYLETDQDSVVLSSQHFVTVIIVSLFRNIITSSRPHLVLTFSRPYPHVLFLVFAHPHILPSSFTHCHALDVMSLHTFLSILITHIPLSVCLHIHTSIPCPHILPF